MKKIKSSREWGKRFEAAKHMIANSHCVSCGLPMPHGTDTEIFVPVCLEPDCPAFGLLQMGIEKTAEYLSKKGINSLPVSKKKSKKE